MRRSRHGWLQPVAAKRQCAIMNRSNPSATRPRAFCCFLACRRSAGIGRMAGRKSACVTPRDRFPRLPPAHAVARASPSACSPPAWPADATRFAANAAMNGRRPPHPSATLVSPLLGLALPHPSGRGRLTRNRRAGSPAAAGGARAAESSHRAAACLRGAAPERMRGGRCVPAAGPGPPRRRALGTIASTQNRAGSWLASSCSKRSSCVKAGTSPGASVGIEEGKGIGGGSLGAGGSDS